MPTTPRHHLSTLRFLRPAAGTILIGTIVFAPLAVGTVHPWARTTVFSMVAVLLVVTLIERIVSGKRIPITAPLLALLVGVTATALQLVPLPARVLSVLSPAAHETLSTTLGDYGTHAISLDPPGTLAELAKLSAYAAFFFSAVIYASRSFRRRHILMAVSGVAVLVAVIGFLQALTGTNKLLFVYDPVARGVNEVLVRGTFVNGNHFGALMCLGSACALGLGLRERKLRVPAFAAAIILNCGAVLSLSRAAMIATPLAQLITFGLDRWQLRHGVDNGARRSRAAGLGLRIGLAAVAMAAVIAGTSLATSRVKSAVELTASIELDDPFGNPRSKFYSWPLAASMAMSYPWTGVGRGAFEQAFTQSYDRGGWVRFPWVENAYLQAFTDWGVPVALMLFVLAGWSLVIALRRLGSDPLGAGALGAVLALAIHEVADFSVELPGIALPTLAVLATLFAGRSSVPDADRKMVGPSRTWLIAPALLAAIVCVAAHTPSAGAAALDLRRELRDPGKPIAEVLAHAERVRAQHPADFYLHIIVAERLAREHHPAALAWLNDAMFLNPTHPAAHVMAAELLANTGRRSQALLEYRVAAGYDPAPRRVWDRVILHYTGLDALLATTDDNPHSLMSLASWLIGRGRNDDAIRVYERVLALDPHHVPALKELIALALARKDVKRARQYASRLLALDSSAEAGLLVARTSLAEGDLRAAAAALDELADRSGRTFDLELELALAYSASGQRQLARRRLDRVASGTSGMDRARWHEAAAEIERRAGNQHQYEWEMEQAAHYKKRNANGR